MKTPVGIEPDQLRSAYLDACRLDVDAMKPGNVSVSAAGHGMSADDFHLSASASVEPLMEQGLGLGARIHRAVLCTRAAVDCNTNLGILLLCAPLVQAALSMGPREKLHGALRRVLRETTVEDADEVFAAIRLANPGGLGEAEEHDVRKAARVTLRQAMSAAADRDLIAAQYANGFSQLFGDALPRLRLRGSTNGRDRASVTDLYLYLLSRFPDSHILRKHGEQVAKAVQENAIGFYPDWRSTPLEQANLQLQQFDQRLKHAGINPGTTADLTVATLFLDRLLHAAALKTGLSRRNSPRRLPLTLGGAPLISMFLIGEF